MINSWEHTRGVGFVLCTKDFVLQSRRSREAFIRKIYSICLCNVSGRLCLFDMCIGIMWYERIASLSSWKIANETVDQLPCEIMSSSCCSVDLLKDQEKL
jgi:hypothetical protein